jgi:chemotaxis signal transduction protein
VILYSKHAREQMVARGISVNEVEEAIRKGSKELQAPNKLLHHFTYFTVVTKKVDGNNFVITVKPRW